jgi:cation transport ATPase
MSLSNTKNDLNKIRPDRLASAFLIIGLLLSCSTALIGVIYFIVGGWPPASLVLPFILLGGVSIIYGLVRTVRGRSATKQSVKAALIKLRNGAIAGSTIAFLAIQIAQNAGNQGSWHNFVYGLISHLIIAIPGALFFGISAGGIGGLILGNVLKSNKAAFLGGVIGGGTTSIWYLLNYFHSL